MQAQYFRNANKKDAIFQDIVFGLPYVELILYSHSYIRSLRGKSGIFKYLQMFVFLVLPPCFPDLYPVRALNPLTTNQLSKWLFISLLDYDESYTDITYEN